MTFDRMRSKIALTVPYFTLRASSDGARKNNRWYNEPYLVSFAVDGSGRASPSLDFNLMPFPKVQRGDTVEMLGSGHLVYGPKQPGEFVAMSLLIMESDSDAQKLGGRIQEFTQSKAVDLGLGVAMSANATAGAALAILKELAQLVAGLLKENGDDELFRMEGTFLRDEHVPYHVNRRYRRGNDFVEVALQVIALDEPNGQGAPVKCLPLKA